MHEFWAARTFTKTKNSVAQGPPVLGITDADSEDTSNSVVKLICDEISSPEACETFDLKVQGLPGDYRGM